MIQAMYSGISGMKAFKGALDVIGNNVANVNTTAYKAGRATFKEMFAQTITGASAPTGSSGGINPTQIGLGVLMGSIDTDQSQGSMTSTGRSNDLAIEGNGFFALGNGSRTYFTRNGSFTTDAEYNLVSSGNGMTVLGWNADINGTIDTSKPVTAASKINIPIGGLSIARQTESVKLGGNLDASGTNDDWEVKFSIYDSLGCTHDVTVNFTKSTTQSAAWNYTVSSPDISATPAVPATTVITSGTINFGENGESLLESIPLSLTFANDNGSAQPLQLSLSTKDLSQLNGQNTVNMTYQDGLPQGTLESYGIDKRGVVSGTFTNGAVRVLGQVALAQFNNPAGLMKSGNSLLSESPNSGAPKIGLAGQGGVGTISSGFLEASNVDLSNEFANMIVTQRGFQANSKIITVSDEVLQELVNLKR